MGTPGYFDQHSLPIEQRLATGLYKIGLAVRLQERLLANTEGLSPTQAQILALLLAEGDQNATELSAAIGVSLPTVSDSVGTLVAKGLVEKRPDPAHHRAARLVLTRAGRASARQAAGIPEFLAPALATLADRQQEQLLTLLLLVIRAMQENGQVPVQRMCLTCTHFRPDAHAGDYPHHCTLVDAPLAAGHLRVVCEEHDLASAADQAARWQQLLAAAG